MCMDVFAMVDSKLWVVFYDMTAIRTEGLTEEDGELRHYGIAKEGGLPDSSCLGSCKRLKDFQEAL
jgi:hypothetical protein